jgi:pimeloyl-ACP methyl ester carboxylesterase
MQPRALIYVPGFPGEAIPRELDEIRVIDLLADIAKSKKLLLTIAHYPGILNPGESFSFEKTKNHTFSQIEQMINLGFAVTLIGHSWGGLISYLGFKKFPIDQLLLITPFLKPISSAEIDNHLNFFSAEFPNLVPLESISNNKNAIISLFSELTQKAYVNNENIIIKAITATNDEIIDNKYVCQFLQSENKVNITEVKNDHNFSEGKSELKQWLIENV